MALRRFIIERDIPKVGTLDREQLRGAAAKSNSVLNQLAPDIQWIESYVTGDKIYCVHEADDAEVVREHARRGGFPANLVVAVANEIAARLDCERVSIGMEKSGSVEVKAISHTATFDAKMTLVRRIADASDLPIIVFQYPLATGQGYPAATLERLRGAADRRVRRRSRPGGRCLVRCR